MEEDMNNHEQLYHVEAQEEITLDKTDILAFIIALFQVVMPIALLVVACFTAVMLLLQFVWLR